MEGFGQLWTNIIERNNDIIGYLLFGIDSNSFVKVLNYT